MTKIGRRVAQRRASLNYTQADLAEKLNISQVQVSKYERGINSIPVDDLAKLSDILNTTPNWLLGLTEDPRADAPSVDKLTRWQQEMLLIMSNHDEDYQQRVVEIAKQVR